MKVKFLLIIACLLFCADSYSQIKNVTDYIQSDQLYLNWNKHNIKFSAIKNSSIIKLLGKPIRIKKEKWETSDANVIRTYIYTNGDLVLEDNDLSFINVMKNGWAFSFKYKSGFKGPFTVGTSINTLIKLFPNSWANRRNNAFDVPIGTCDCSIVFETDGYKLIKISLDTNES